MLAINTFQRSRTNNDPIHCVSSTKLPSSIALKDALLSIQDVDASPHVKKPAAFAMIQACEPEPARSIHISRTHSACPAAAR
jgi:hypothetical protein